MTDDLEIPDYLRRTKGHDMTHTQAQAGTPAPATTPKKKRQDCRIYTVKVMVPMPATGAAETMTAAEKTLAELESGLPEGSRVEVSATFGKM